jgi:hypothetical protein
VRAQVSHALGEYQVVVWMSRESETFDDCPLIFVTRSELSLSDEARFGERAAHRLISLSLRATTTGQSISFPSSLSNCLFHHLACHVR